MSELPIGKQLDAIRKTQGSKDCFLMPGHLNIADFFQRLFTSRTQVRLTAAITSITFETSKAAVASTTKAKPYVLKNKTYTIPGKTTGTIDYDVKMYSSKNVVKNAKIIESKIQTLTFEDIEGIIH